MKLFQVALLIEATDIDSLIKSLKRDGYSDNEIVGDITERTDWGDGSPYEG